VHRAKQHAPTVFSPTGEGGGISGNRLSLCILIVGTMLRRVTRRAEDMARRRAARLVAHARVVRTQTPPQSSRFNINILSPPIVAHNLFLTYSSPSLLQVAPTAQTISGKNSTSLVPLTSV